MQGIPMQSVLIRRPRQAVFDFVMDLPQTPRWRPRMRAVEWLDATEPEIGSTFTVKVKMLGWSFGFEPEITNWDPPRSVSYRQTTGPVLTESHMEWLEVEDGTIFRMGGTPSAGNRVMAFLGPLFEGPLLRQNHYDLQRLKQILEAGTTN